MKSGPKTIKKHENRRLYDPDARSYVTLEEIRERIARGTEVRVVEARSGGDVTASVLAQIVVERGCVARHLTASLLLDMIRMDPASLSELLRGALAKSTGVRADEPDEPRATQTLWPPAPF